MVRLTFVFLFIVRTGFSAWAEECRLNNDQLEQIARAVICESSENLNDCKSVLGLNSESKVAERVGHRIGSLSARKMWGGAAAPNTSSKALIATQYEPTLRALEKDLEDRIAEHQSARPEFLENKTRKAQIIFERRLELFKETGYPDEKLKAYAQSYAKETDPTKKAGLARTIQEQHFSKLEKEFGDRPVFKKFQGREASTEFLYKDLEEAVKNNKPLSLEDKQRFLNSGFTEAEIDSINKHIEIKTDPSKDLKLKRLKGLQVEARQFRYTHGQLMPTIEQAKHFRDFALRNYGTISSSTYHQAIQLSSPITMAESANGARRAYQAGLTGTRWAVGKAGSRVAAHFVNAPAAVAYDIYDLSSMAYYYKSHQDCIKGSPYVDCDDKGRPVLEVTPKTKDFLGLDWNDQKKELDADPNLCFKMSSVFRTYVEPKWDVKCADDGFEINQPIGYTSSVNVRTKTNPSGELQETIWDVQGPEKDSLPKGSFYISYKDGSPEQVRYRKLDLATSLKRKTGLMKNEETERKISNYQDPNYYSEYPVGQRLRNGSSIDYVAGTLNTVQHQQRLMVEVGMCCGSTRNEVGEKRCHALGVSPARGAIMRGSNANR